MTQLEAGLLITWALGTGATLFASLVIVAVFKPRRGGLPLTDWERQWLHGAALAALTSPIWPLMLLAWITRELRAAWHLINERTKP